MSGPRGPPKGKVGVPGIGSPSAGPLSHPQSTVAPSQGSQHHTTGSVTLDCDAQPQGPHQAPGINSNVQQRPGMNSKGITNVTPIITILPSYKAF